MIIVPNLCDNRQGGGDGEGKGGRREIVIGPKWTDVYRKQSENKKTKQKKTSYWQLFNSMEKRRRRRRRKTKKT